MKRRDPTPEQLQWAIEQRKKTPPVRFADIGKQIGIDRDRLRKLMSPELRQHRNVLTLEDIDAIVQAYRHEPGVSIRALAKRHNAHYTTIRKALKTRGVKLRQPGQTVTESGKTKQVNGSKPLQGDEPIGQSEKFAEIDSIIIRERLAAARKIPSRFRATQWSSLAWVE